MKDKPKIQQSITKKDLVKCPCGSDEFISTHHVAVKKSPIIGETPAMIGIPKGFRCVVCNEFLSPEEKKDEILVRDDS